MEILVWSFGDVHTAQHEMSCVGLAQRLIANLQS